MQNILLIGEFNNTLKNIFNSLQGVYQVQLCKISLEYVAGMIEMTEPELALISMYGSPEFDMQILEHFQKLDNRIPVVFVGTFEECRECINHYNDSWFSFVERPATQKDLLKKCKEMLELAQYSNKLLGKIRKNSNAENVKKKILVVDDNGVFLRTAKSILESKYEVILAKSGEKALTMAATENPDLILLDYEMPGWNGKETLENLRSNEETESIPVVFLTGVSDKGHIMDVLKLQPQGYMLKPIDSDELEKKIVEVIGE